MVLVDSSVWIAADRGLLRIDDIVREDDVVATCPAIIHEVLRGAQSAKQHQTLRMALMATEILDAPTPLRRFEEAVAIYKRCRLDGMTAMGIDCLIAACAIAHRVPLLHQDADFDQMARSISLKFFSRS